ncbi:MAG TPA: nucleotidyltransferase domain-containing protein [Vicinamibacterales bacterium]|nr:nucleotidyltransferase domain-containing protein [Vicinamibacterales bacterium]
MGRDADPLIERFRREYLPSLRALYAPDAVIAFGSRARGDALEDSDLDLIVVSKSFRGMRFIDRPAAVLQALRPSIPVELLCYTPEEFERKRREAGIVAEAVSDGIVL